MCNAADLTGQGPLDRQGGEELGNLGSLNDSEGIRSPARVFAEQLQAPTLCCPTRPLSQPTLQMCPPWLTCTQKVF